MPRAYVLGLWTLVLLASPAAAQSKRPGLDLYGDALPEGALLRIGSLRLQTGGRIGDLRFSRDGKQIVAATRTMGVYVWDVATGKELHHLPRLTPTPFDNEPRVTDKFVGRVLAPGGKYVAEVDRKSVLSLKEVATGREIITGRSELFQVDARRIQFSPNGKTLAVMRFGVTNDGSIPISLYEVASGKQLQSQAVVRLSPGGTHVAEVSKQGLVRLRTVVSGREVQFDRKPWEVARAVAFAPNDKTLAIMDAATSTVHLYAVASGKLLESQPFAFAHDHRSVVIGIGPDGRTVTLASLGAGVHLYQANTRKRFVREGNSKAGAFSPDGKLVATSSGHLIEVATGKSVPIKAKCHDLRFTADGRRLAVLEDPHRAVVKVFETATGRLVQTSTQGGGVDLIAISHDGKYLAGADGGEGVKFGPGHGAAVRLWHADTGKPVHPFADPPAKHLTVKFAPDGKTITAISHPRYYFQPTSGWVWDAAGGKLRRRVAWDGGSGNPTGTLSADGRVLARTKSGEKLIVSDVATHKILMQGEAVRHTREPLLLSPDARFLLARCWDYMSTRDSLYAIHLWDVASGKQLLATEWSKAGYHHGYLDGSGRILVVLYRPDGDKQPTELTCYDLATGRKLPRGTLTRTISQDTQVSVRYRPMISPDGRLLAEPPADGGPVEVRELATGQLVGSLPARGHVVSSPLSYLFNNDRVAFSPRGRLLAAATTAGAILVWDVATSQVVAELKGHRGIVSTLSWSADGKRLVSSGEDMTLVIWDAAPWWARVEKARHRLTPQQLETLWRDLASEQGQRGYNAVWQLVRAPQQAVALLRQRLPGAGSKAAATVRALLADLDSAKFAVREKAYIEMEKLVDLALPGLERALAGSLEGRKRAEQLLQKLDQRPLPAAVRQQLRALKVLETLGTAEAQALLQQLANEDPYAWLTREARLALARGR